MSERAYAAHSGLSRGAVQKARKTGRLVLFADGSINAAASDIRRSAMTDPDQQMRSRGGSGAGGDGAGIGTGSVSGPGDSTSYLKARTALTVYQAQERQHQIEPPLGGFEEGVSKKEMCARYVSRAHLVTYIESVNGAV